MSQRIRLIDRNISKISYKGERVQYSIYKNQSGNANDIRRFAQTISNQVAKRYPNEQMSVLLNYKGREFYNSGKWTKLGNAVSLHDPSESDVNDIEEVGKVYNFMIQTTFSLNLFK